MAENNALQESKGNSVALSEKGFAPGNAGELMRIAEFIARSKLKPNGLDNASDCFLVMAYGQAYGMDPMMALQQLHVVKGKVGLPGETCAALIQSHPACKDFRVWVEGEGDTLSVVVQSWRKGRERANEPVRFSMAQAKQAGLTAGENWKKYPEDMLRWKAVARDKRINWPDVMPGLQVREDIEEVRGVRVERRTEVSGPDPMLAALSSGEPEDPEGDVVDAEFEHGSLDLTEETDDAIKQRAGKFQECEKAYELIYAGLRHHFGGSGGDPNGDNALEYIRNAKVDTVRGTVNSEQVEP